MTGPFPKARHGLALALILAGAAPALAAGENCPTRPPAPEVIVRIEQDTVTVHETRTMRQLRDMAGKAGRADSHPAGLYKGAIETNWITEAVGQPVGRRYCVHIGRVELTLRLKTPSIWLGRELGPDMCRREAVWQHEIVHYRIDQDIVKRHAPRLRQAIEEAARRSDVILVATRVEADRATNRLAALIDDAAKRAVGAMNEERARLQDSLDTPEEYARASRACTDGRLGASRPLLCQDRPDLCTDLNRP